MKPGVQNTMLPSVKLSARQETIIPTLYERLKAAYTPAAAGTGFIARAYTRIITSND